MNCPTRQTKRPKEKRFKYPKNTFKDQRKALSEHMAKLQAELDDMARKSTVIITPKC